MTRLERTVFISYRRADRWAALAVFKDLTQHGYDVFLDYDGIASGDFEHAIVDNIRSRAHFVLLLTPSALQRCDNPDDWLRREIELAIDCGRNIVPLLFGGFTMTAPLAVERLQGTLAPLGRYQAVNVPDEFFDAAMERLRTKFLAVPIDAVVHPASAHARTVAEGQRAAAAQAADASGADGSAPRHDAVASTGAAPALSGSPALDTTSAGTAGPVPPGTAGSATAGMRASKPPTWSPAWVATGAGVVIATAIGAWMLANSGKKESAPPPVPNAATPGVIVGGQNNVGVGTNAGTINIGAQQQAPVASAARAGGR